MFWHDLQDLWQLFFGPMRHNYHLVLAFFLDHLVVVVGWLVLVLGLELVLVLVCWLWPMGDLMDLFVCFGCGIKTALVL